MLNFGWMGFEWMELPLYFCIKIVGSCCWRLLTLPLLGGSVLWTVSPVWMHGCSGPANPPAHHARWMMCGQENHCVVLLTPTIVSSVLTTNHLPTLYSPSAVVSYLRYSHIRFPTYLPWLLSIYIILVGTR